MAAAGCRLSFCARAVAAALLLAAAAAAQYPPVAPEAGDSDVRLSGAGVAGYVPGIDSAATPQCVTTSDGTLHVAWLDYRTLDPKVGPRWSVLYRSVKNWQAAATPADLVLGPETRLSASTLNATGLAMAGNGSNLVVFTWIEIEGSHEQLRARRLKLTGSSTSLGNTSTLNTALQAAGNPYIGPPDIACVHTPGGQDYAYVTWAQYDGLPGSGAGLATGHDQVFFARSQNGGQGWSGPASVADTVNLDRSSHHEAPRLAADALGGVYVAFLDTRLSVTGGAQALDVFVRSSTDFGVNFGAETQLSRACVAPPCLPPAFSAIRPSIAAPGNGTVAVAWIDASCANFGRTLMRSRRSLNLGASWDCETTVGRATGLMLHVDTDLAASPTGQIWATWGRVDLDAPPARTSVFATRLDPATGVWQQERRVSVGGAVLGSKGAVPPLPRPRIVADPAVPSRALVTWMHTENGFEQEFDVVAAWTLDGGVSWHAPSAVVTEPGPVNRKTRAAFPVPVLAGGRAGIVWDDRRHWTNPIVAGLPLPPGSPQGAPSVYFNWIDLGVAGGVP
jgi:hypothetical protein